MADTTANLKIGELARRTGVSVPTIHYYQREGLLPAAPRKTSRNMAYYDESYVTRIQMIRRLQKERRLPLSVIRSLITEGAAESDESILALAELRAKGVLPMDPGDEDETLSHDELIAHSGVHPEDLRELEEMGVLSPHGSKKRRRYGAHDVGIAGTVAKLRAMGLSRDLFPSSDLTLYQRTISELVGEEARLFGRGIRGNETRFSSRQQFEATIELIGELMLQLRRKLILDLTSSLDLQASAPTSASPKRKAKKDQR